MQQHREQSQSNAKCSVSHLHESLSFAFKSSLACSFQRSACTAPLMMIKALMQYNMHSLSLAFIQCDTSQLIARAAHTFYVAPFALNNVKIQLLLLLSGDIAWCAARAHSSIMDTCFHPVNFLYFMASVAAEKEKKSRGGDPRSQNPFHEFTIKKPWH